MKKGNDYNHKLPDIKELKILYFDNKSPAIQIAEKYNVTFGAVKNKFNRYGIKLRTHSEAQKGNENALGHRHSGEHKKRMSILHKKLGHHFPSRKGIKLTEEHKKKIGRKGEMASNWKGGISFEPYPITWTKTLKKSIKERDNYICQLCFKKGNAIHHIDYDKENCNPDNLITLCLSCNAKVNFKRKYWKIYFNNLIKERNYASKKSKRR